MHQNRDSAVDESANLRVIIITGDADNARGLAREVEGGGYRLVWEHVATLETMHAMLDAGEWDLVLADYDLDHFGGIGAFALLRQRDPVMPFIIVCDKSREHLALGALKVGVDDYVSTDDIGRLVPAVERSLRVAEDRRIRYRTEDALRRSEERYRELVENANDVLFTMDLKGNFTSLNTAGELISGYTREQVSEMNMTQVLAPESLGIAREMIRQKLEDNLPTVYELIVIAQDGHYVPLEVSTRLITHGGVPVGIQGIARDVTERHRAAQALRESEERYRSLFENASDIVYTHDLQGRFTSVNRAAERATGYTREEMMSLVISDIVAPEFVELAQSMLRNKLSDPRPTKYEIDICNKDGATVSVEINSRLVFEHGKPCAVQGIARDVTERRRIEADLRARERKQAAVAELGQQALVQSDSSALFDVAVTTVADTLGVEFCAVTELLSEQGALLGRAGFGWPKGVLGATTVGIGVESQAGFALMSNESVVMEDADEETRFAIPQILREHAVRSGASVIIHGRDGPFGVLSTFTRTLRCFTRDDVNFLQAVANVLAAAIERSRMETARARHAHELATRVLQAQEEERKRIARELHDETAQSLSTLLINLDLLEPHIPEQSQILQDGFQRVRSLARRTLDETRALSHDLRPTILDDVGLVAALQWFGAESEKTYGMKVHVDAQSGNMALTPEVEVALFRIAQEALTNTGKHADATQVHVSLGFHRQIARLTVEDNGKGYDPERVSGPTREGRLGLYGMQERAALLGGSVRIKTGRGRGTRLEVRLPVVVGSEFPAGSSGHPSYAVAGRT